MFSWGLNTKSDFHYNNCIALKDIEIKTLRIAIIATCYSIPAWKWIGKPHWKALFIRVELEKLKFPKGNIKLRRLICMKVSFLWKLLSACINVSDYLIGNSFVGNLKRERTWMYELGNDRTYKTISEEFQFKATNSYLWKKGNT